MKLNLEIQRLKAHQNQAVYGTAEAVPDTNLAYTTDWQQDSVLSRIHSQLQCRQKPRRPSSLYRLLESVRDLQQRGSLQARPKNEMPTGRPKTNLPAR